MLQIYSTPLSQVIEKLRGNTIEHLALAIDQTIVAVDGLSFEYTKVIDTLVDGLNRDVSQICKLLSRDTNAL
jgi:hypothetical protein